MTNQKKKQIRKALFVAFPHTLPILASFLFLGLAYGIYMHVSGFSFLYPVFLSIFLFTGSVEFLMPTILMSSFDPLRVFLISFMVGARHLFYGISMLEKYRGTGIKKPYLIYALCDETFSINYSAEIPADVNRGWFFFWVTFLNQIYWVSGATLGGILGNMIRIELHGLEFVMTAMFTAIFVDQFMKEEQHISSLIGIAIPMLCLILFGGERFIIPSMLLILAALSILRGRLEGLT